MNQPTKPGYYWVIFNDKTEPEPIRLYQTEMLIVQTLREGVTKFKTSAVKEWIEEATPSISDVDSAIELLVNLTPTNKTEHLVQKIRAAFIEKKQQEIKDRYG